jgi:hypothetical protein
MSSSSTTRIVSLHSLRYGVPPMRTKRSHLLARARMRIDQRLRRVLASYKACWELDIPVPRGGFCWRYDRFHAFPKRDLTAARLFLRLALSGTDGIRPRVINVMDIRRTPERLPN